jgi:hypothetical protein
MAYAGRMPRTKKSTLPARRGLVSGEFAIGNRLASSTALMVLNFRLAGAKLTSTGGVIFWGCLSGLMNLSRRVKGTQEMVATLKRPPPAGRPQ